MLFDLCNITLEICSGRSVIYMNIFQEYTRAVKSNARQQRRGLRASARLRTQEDSFNNMYGEEFEVCLYLHSIILSSFSSLFFCTMIEIIWLKLIYSYVTFLFCRILIK